MLLAAWFTTYKNGDTGDIAREIGPLSVPKILGGFVGLTMLMLTGTERFPLLWLMSSRVTSLPEKSAIYRKSPEVCGFSATGFDPTGKLGVPKGTSAPLDWMRN